MPQTYLSALCEKDQQVNPLFTFLGARLVHAENGEARITLPVAVKLCQGGGVMAGGILATLADETMAHAVISLLESGQTTVTVEMNIRYLRSVVPDQCTLITATGRIVKKGRRSVVTEAAVFDDRERLLATAGATFFVKELQ